MCCKEFGWALHFEQMYRGASQPKRQTEKNTTEDRYEQQLKRLRAVKILPRESKHDKRSSKCIRICMSGVFYVRNVFKVFKSTFTNITCLWLVDVNLVGQFGMNRCFCIGATIF